MLKVYKIKWLLLSIGFLVGSSLFAQPSGKAKPQRDPDATRILQRIKKEYDTYRTVEVDFEMEMEFPGQAPEKQKGKLIQEGAKYHVQTDQFVIISDAKTLWFVNKVAKEGQINHVNKDDGLSLYSPLELMKIYEKDDHHIGLVNEYKEKGQIIQQIEFVPLNRGADYSKARLSVVKGTQQIQEVRFFNRDGSRMVLFVKQLNKNKPVGADQFTFKAAKFPGIHMEDLR